MHPLFSQINVNINKAYTSSLIGFSLLGRCAVVIDYEFQPLHLLCHLMFGLVKSQKQKNIYFDMGAFLKIFKQKRIFI